MVLSPVQCQSSRSEHPTHPSAFLGKARVQSLQSISLCGCGAHITGGLPNAPRGRLEDTTVFLSGTRSFPGLLLTSRGAIAPKPLRSRPSYLPFSRPPFPITQHPRGDLHLKNNSLGKKQLICPPLYLC